MTIKNIYLSYTKYYNVHTRHACYAHTEYTWWIPNRYNITYRLTYYNYGYCNFRLLTRLNLTKTTPYIHERQCKYGTGRPLKKRYALKYMWKNVCRSNRFFLSYFLIFLSTAVAVVNTRALWDIPSDVRNRRFQREVFNERVTVLPRS